MALRTLRTVHRWIGLLLALPIAIQGLTGAILAVEPWLPERTEALQPGTAQPASVVAAAARNAVGPDARVTRYTLPGGPGHAARVQVARPGRPLSTLLVDPVSLARVGEPNPTWGWLRSLHVQFLAPAYGGRSIGGWFGVGLVVLLVSGIPIWWPGPGGWRAGFTVAWHASGVRFHRRLHGAIGIWTAAVLLVLAATGIVLAFPRTSRGMMGLTGGGPPAAMRVHTPGSAVESDLDRAIAIATEAVPQARATSVALPNAAGEAVRVFLLHDGASGALGSVVVQVDAIAGRVLSVQDARAMPAADRTYRLMHDLHEGAVAGPVWRLLAALAGIALPVFAITGPTMWWLRHRARRRLGPARRAALQSGSQL